MNTIDRRTHYDEVAGEPERFIVPLVKNAVIAALNIVSKSLSQGRVLDVGAGECPLKQELQARCFKYTSLDIGQNATGTIDYEAPIDGPLPSGLLSAPGFDLILCTEVLEHVADWKTAFENLSKLTRPGGFCILTAPFLYMPHEEPHDYWRPTSHAFRYFLKLNNFEVVHEQRLGDGWDVLGTVLASVSLCRQKKTLLAYLALIPLYAAHYVAKHWLARNILRGQVRIQSQLYLGNLFVLRRVESRT